MYCPHCMHIISNDEQTNICPICGGNLDIQNLISQLPVGTILADRYYLGKVIGQGGFGITYIGCDLKLNMKIAVKEYYPQGLVNRITKYSTELTVTAGEQQDLYERQKKRFISEARILAEFADDPYIVRVSDILPENNTIYIIMEYIDGITLGTYCRENGRMDFNEVLSMLDPIMESLGAIHAKGLIHRDISPTNIMITSRRKMAKLLDFGAAADYGTELNRSVSVVLKEGYAPPEQYSSHGNRGPWSDVYALCATIYSLITGLIPKNSVERMVKDELRYPSEFGVKITPEQEAVLMCGLAVQLGQRFSSMKDLQNGFHSADKGIVPECAKPFFKSKKGIVSPSYQETEILSGDFGGQLDGREATHSLKDSSKAGEDSGSSKWTKRGSSIARFLIIAALIVVCWVFVKPYYAPYYGETLNNLGVMFCYGRGVNRNYEKAVMCYRLGADTGYADAQYNLGFMYENGYGVDQDYEKAAKYYQLAADQGNIEAQYNIGFMYENGHGVIKDYETAAKYYQLAANQGHGKAQSVLGDMYYYGTGVSLNFEEAAKYYQLAAKNKRTTSQQEYNLGFMYENGYGVDQDFKMAVKYYRLAANKKFAAAQYNLGYMYDNGYGVDQDYAEAVKYYRLAADQGNAGAQNNLGYMYANGLGVDQDYEEALKYYRLAADQGNSSAQNNLGYMYENGLGGDQDYEEAVRYYRLAADQGNAAAQSNLGYMYDIGRGVVQNYAEAVKYYRLAADQGNAIAQFNLGTMYEDGHGVEQD